MMKTYPIKPQTSVADILEQYPQTVPIFLEHRMNCIGCDVNQFETLEAAADIYGIPLDTLLTEIDRSITQSKKSTGAIQEEEY